MKIAQALKEATAKLDSVCQRPKFEAELLMAFYLKVDRSYLIIHDNQDIKVDEYFELIDRRASYEPYEYITNQVSFYDIELFVKKGVLIPRPETEILIDKVSDIIQNHDIKKIAEIGVGSGAISVVLARKFPHLKIVASDISLDALNIAKTNVQNFNLQEQITLKHTSLLDGIEDKFDLVVSNPPYIADDFILDKNVVEYEPKEALFGGRVGDELLKDIIQEVKHRDIRWLCCEMGYDQKEPLLTFVRDTGVYCVEFYKDLANLDRGFVIDFKGDKDEKKL